jgi:hypothetical protein
MRTGGIGFGNGGIGIVDWGCWIWTGGFWGAVLANSQTVSPDTWGRPREIWVRDKARVRFPRVRRALQLDLERESLLPRRGPRHFEAADLYKIGRDAPHQIGRLVPSRAAPLRAVASIACRGRLPGGATLVRAFLTDPLGAHARHSTPPNRGPAPERICQRLISPFLSGLGV